ncbi:MAG: class I mannose-6-phosphate isomerase [Ruminococcus sp.]|nr:class I mannose-6-phosphate isomerase [Ruminococcus sp.]
MTPFRLKAPCKDYLWGGEKLRAYGKISDADRIAESWELSCHPDGESIVMDGESAGRTLSAVLAEHPEAMGEHCRKFDRFPVLVKLIDAKDDLSVQVHPDDAYALAHEGEYGKTEMWYIVEAAPDAELIYGFRENITKEEFRRAIEENSFLDKVNRVPVQKGDVFFIEAGTLHAIGKGILIAEIQQNSNTTYRVYDYGRVGADGKPRDLHIEKALDVTTLTPAKQQVRLPQTGSTQLLAQCRYFCAVCMEVETFTQMRTDSTSFLHMLVLEGNAVLKLGDFQLPLQKGTSVFVPAGTGAFRIIGKCKFISTTIQ